MRWGRRWEAPPRASGSSWFSFPLSDLLRVRVRKGWSEPPATFVRVPSVLISLIPLL
jgi:hypothetical protein